jgi:lysophospholipase L1-like esterase
MILEPFVLPGSATENNEEHPHRWEFFRDEVKLRGEAAKRIAEKYNLPFVPLQDMFTAANADAPSNDYWTRDGVHPTAAGHTLIKRAWLKAFENL